MLKTKNVNLVLRKEENMKNLTKKLLTVLMAVALVFTSVNTVKAGDNDGVNRATNHEKLSITGLQKGGETVELYQLLKAEYEEDGLRVKKYTLDEKLADASEKVVFVAADPANNVEEVSALVSELTVGLDGKVAAEHKVNGDEYDVPAELVGKFPFHKEAPTEKQISAISADIAKNPTVWAGNKKAVEGTVDTSSKKWEVEAYAKAAKADGDKSPAIYDATGIYLGKVFPVENDDTVYNPVIVSVGYKNDTDNNVSFTTEGISMTAGYDAPSVAVKKSTPKVDKTVTGGFVEKGVARPIVATDEEGNPKYQSGHDGDPDYFLYLKSKNPYEETANCEEALTEGTDIHSGAEGTKFTYSVKPELPSYPENAVNKTLWFSDTLSEGLDYIEGTLVVSIVGANVTKSYDASTKKYVFKIGEKVLANAVDNANGFNITFDYDVIPGGKDAVMELNYEGVLKREAFVGLQGNPNVVTMVYANRPDEGNTHDVEDTGKPDAKGNKEVEDYEIVYTYEIFFKKVDQDGKPLAGAIFGLYAAEEIKYTPVDDNTPAVVLYAKDQLICTIETNEEGLGYTTIVGPGKYYLQEIKAPQDYQLNSNKYDVPELKWTTATKKATKTIESWEYTPTKPTKAGYTEQVGWLVGAAPNTEFYQLADYPTALDDSWVAAYIDPDKHVFEKTFTEETVENKENNGGWITISEPIPNTKTPSLPSTGGVGTYIFTIAGVAILATAAFMLIFRKREDA